MNPSTALRTGARLLWERSASVLPVYLLASGLYGAARAPLVVAGVAAVWLLAAGGRLDPFIDRLRAAEGGSAGSAATGTGNGTLPPELADAVAGVLTPGVVLVVAGGVLASAALAVIASAVGNAAAVGGLFGLLRGDDGVRAAVAGVRRHWRPFVGVRLLVVAAVAAALTPLVGLVAAVIGVTAGAGGLAGTRALGVVAAVLGGLVTLLAVPVVLVLVAFADQAVVVDDVGAVAGVTRSARLPLRRPIAVLGYVAVATGAVLVSVVVGGLAATAGAPRTAALVSAVLVPPVVDGFKTALYAETPLPPAPDGGPQPVGRRIRAAFGGGLRSVAGFVGNHPLANLAAFGCFAAGGAAGWLATATIGADLPVGGDVGGVFGAVPVGTFVNLATNNWLVAVDLAYSGVAAGVPAVVTLVFNGLLVGAVGGVFDPVAFLALVAPHGVIEIPALVVGGAAGLSLGGVGVGAIRGRYDDRDVAGAIKRTYRVLLGLVVLFVVAAFIEAFLTPAVAGAVLGG
ncbi:stage II sporulation protein M [Halobellus salinus]|uniref:stage II sporulation protein M n=1 Tax=Halobellus salinus TaxID=931585 RepID=UPI001E431F04|nr:stage II sporulation protein M [Halobellus salinus]